MGQKHIMGKWGYRYRSRASRCRGQQLQEFASFKAVRSQCTFQVKAPDPGSPMEASGWAGVSLYKKEVKKKNSLPPASWSPGLLNRPSQGKGTQDGRASHPGLGPSLCK